MENTVKRGMFAPEGSYISPREAGRRIDESRSATARLLYRRGLALAADHNLSLAAQTLERAAFYDKRRPEIWDLLGLVYFQAGELGEALRCWQIGTSAASFVTSTVKEGPRKGHKSADYLKTLRQEETMVLRMEESLRLYNEALEFCQKGERGFAKLRLEKAVRENPRFVRGRELLAACHMEDGEYRAANARLIEALRIDRRSERALRYRAEIERRLREGAEDKTREKAPDLSEDAAVQEALPDPDMKLLSLGHEKRERVADRRVTLMQLLSFVAGTALGIGFMALLWTPSRIKDAEDSARSYRVEAEQLLREKEAEAALKEEALSLLEEIEAAGKNISELVLARIRSFLQRR